MMARETSDVECVIALLVEVNLLIVCFKIRPSTRVLLSALRCVTSVTGFSLLLLAHDPQTCPREMGNTAVLLASKLKH